MAKTKFTVNLGNLKLSQKDHKKIMDAVHKTVNNELKSIIPPKGKKAPPKVKKKLARSLTVIEAVATATVTATFTNVEPGLSELNATFNNATQKLTQSGTLKFKDVKRGDFIEIQGKSLGTSDISIDVKASPQAKKFQPGTFNFNFVIL